MKKLLLLVLTALMMVGCDDKKVKYKVTEDYFIIEIDSCEYVKYNPAYGFQHKGNCKYCTARRKQELKEFVEQLKK